MPDEASFYQVPFIEALDLVQSRRAVVNQVCVLAVIKSDSFVLPQVLSPPHHNIPTQTCLSRLSNRYQLPLLSLCYWMTSQLLSLVKSFQLVLYSVLIYLCLIL